MKAPTRAICAAIRARRRLRFLYDGSLRIVEPHQYGEDAAGDLVLNAWQLSGGSGVDWRTFRADRMDEVAMLDTRFDQPRPGYNPGGFPLKRTICAL